MELQRLRHSSWGLDGHWSPRWLPLSPPVPRLHLNLSSGAATPRLPALLWLPVAFGTRHLPFLACRVPHIRPPRPPACSTGLSAQGSWCTPAWVSPVCFQCHPQTPSANSCSSSRPHLLKEVSRPDTLAGLVPWRPGATATCTELLATGADIGQKLRPNPAPAQGHSSLVTWCGDRTDPRSSAQEQ
jgi:hypothetical protein